MTVEALTPRTEEDMHPAFLVALSVFVPFGCLGLLLFLAKLEDTLIDDVEKTERRHQPAPAPIVAIPLPPEPVVRTAVEHEPARSEPVVSPATAAAPITP